MTTARQSFWLLQLAGATMATYSLASAVTTLAVARLVTIPFEVADADEAGEEDDQAIVENEEAALEHNFSMTS